MFGSKVRNDKTIELRKVANGYIVTFPVLKDSMEQMGKAMGKALRRAQGDDMLETLNDANLIQDYQYVEMETKVFTTKEGMLAFLAGEFADADEALDINK